jgi:alcohol dehydrogenase
MTLSTNYQQDSLKLCCEFDLKSSIKLFYGEGTRELLKQEIRAFNNLIIVCSGNGRRRITEDLLIASALEDKTCTWLDIIDAYPTLEDAKAVLESGISSPDAILAIGGGSVLDFAKVLSVLMPVRGKLTIHEVCDDASALDDSVEIPTFLVPTTCGTGSEITPFATLWDSVSQSKKSLSHEKLLPSLVIGDPDLILKLPNDVICTTALDALSQNLESLWNVNADEKSRSIATQGLRYSVEGLERYASAGITPATANLLLRASLYSGAAIAKTRTAICHAISYPLTARYGVPHGIACAFSVISVLTQVMSESNEFKTLILQILGLHTTKDVLSKMDKLFTNLSFDSTLKALLPPVEEVLLLGPEMLGSIRSQNTIVDIDIDKLEIIICRSYVFMHKKL